MNVAQKVRKFISCAGLPLAGWLLVFHCASGESAGGADGSPITHRYTVPSTKYGPGSIVGQTQSGEYAGICEPALIVGETAPTVTDLEGGAPAVVTIPLSEPMREELDDSDAAADRVALTLSGGKIYKVVANFERVRSKLKAGPCEKKIKAYLNANAGAKVLFVSTVYGYKFSASVLDKAGQALKPEATRRVIEAALPDLRLNSSGAPGGDRVYVGFSGQRKGSETLRKKMKHSGDQQHLLDDDILDFTDEY